MEETYTEGALLLMIAAIPPVNAAAEERTLEDGDLSYLLFLLTLRLC